MNNPKPQIENFCEVARQFETYAKDMGLLDCRQGLARST